MWVRGVSSHGDADQKPCRASGFKVKPDWTAFYQRLFAFSSSASPYTTLPPHQSGLGYFRGDKYCRVPVQTWQGATVPQDPFDTQAASPPTPSPPHRGIDGLFQLTPLAFLYCISLMMHVYFQPRRRCKRNMSLMWYFKRTLTPSWELVQCCRDRRDDLVYHPRALFLRWFTRGRTRTHPVAGNASYSSSDWMLQSTPLGFFSLFFFLSPIEQ